MDSQFESHGKELRKLGADVIILKCSDSADEAIEVIFIYRCINNNTKTLKGLKLYDAAPHLMTLRILNIIILSFG